jgi:hypothetical protein
MTDIRRALESLVPDAKWDFSIPNEGGDESQYNAIQWADARAKPTWPELVAVAEGFAAADHLARRQSAVLGPIELGQMLEAIGMFNQVNDWANAQGGLTAYAWNRASQFERLHPMVLAAQSAMGWTDEQVDALFGI